MSINGVGPTPLTSHFKTTVLLELLHDPDETPVTVSCHAIDHLSPDNNLNIDVHRKLMKEHKLEPIADPRPGDKAAVDILLSHADGYACRKGPDLPFPSLRCGFVLTKFGWTVGGASLKEGFTTAQARQTTVTSEEVLDKALERMWNFSSIPDDNSTMSPEELSAVHQFKDTFKRLPDGSYEVTIPKKTPLPVLGESRSMALKVTVLH